MPTARSAVRTTASPATPKPNIILDDNNRPIRVENVRSARGFMCTGEVIYGSYTYENSIMVKDDSDGFLHLVSKKSIGMSLMSPTTKKDRDGQVKPMGGFVQPLTPAKTKDPIMQTRRTNSMM